MQLTLLKRVMLALLGLGAIATGVICAASGWSVPSVPLVTIGVVVFAGAIIGQVPSGNIKELQLRWRDQELYDHVDRLEQVLTRHREDVDADLQAVRQATREVCDKLDDYLLALEPNPADGYDDGEQRLRAWESDLQGLEIEISSRRFTGEDYDDGVGLEQLVKARETLSADLARERRRQEARRKYGHLSNARPPQSRMPSDAKDPTSS